MSAALKQPAESARRTTVIDILTDPDVTPELLRIRAAYWRAQSLRYDRAGRADQAARMRASCDRMESLAVALETACATVQPRAPRPAKGKAGMIGAEEFQDGLAAAVQAARAEIGDPWYARSADDCVLLVLPARLAQFRGPLGSMIRYRRDLRAPAARFWPGGTIPVGAEVRPDYAREPYPRQGMTEAEWRTHELRTYQAQRKRAETRLARELKLAKLAAMTVERGCTPAEAETAAALAVKMASSDADWARDAGGNVVALRP